MTTGPILICDARVPPGAQLMRFSCDGGYIDVNVSDPLSVPYLQANHGLLESFCRRHASDMYTTRAGRLFTKCITVINLPPGPDPRPSREATIVCTRPESVSPLQPPVPPPSPASPDPSHPSAKPSAKPSAQCISLVKRVDVCGDMAESVRRACAARDFAWRKGLCRSKGSQCDACVAICARYLRHYDTCRRFRDEGTHNLALDRYCCACISCERSVLKATIVPAAIARYGNTSFPVKIMVRYGGRSFLFQ